MPASGTAATIRRSLALAANLAIYLRFWTACVATALDSVATRMVWLIAQIDVEIAREVNEIINHMTNMLFRRRPSKLITPP
jgi:hypothetical protein